MARRNHLDDFTRGRMIGKLEEGRTVTNVTAELGINKMSFRELESVPNHRGRRQSASVITQQLTTTTGRQVSRFTVARRLHEGGLFAHRPERCLPLKVNHQRHRLQWCREKKNLDNCQWSRVLFMDESRFSTRSDSQRVLIWREIGTWFYTSNIKVRHHYGGPEFLSGEALC
ncbi:transposable element Tcb2 transposase [Trichonephila clavipes]|nr:transposable element Tcb2 transposase [Trichonephila clavipes]